jgi:hypothetical protein
LPSYHFFVPFRGQTNGQTNGQNYASSVGTSLDDLRKRYEESSSPELLDPHSDEKYANIMKMREQRCHKDGDGGSNGDGEGDDKSPLPPPSRARGAA